MSKNKYTTVHSWNMQGGGETKLSKIENYNRDILLLQESGTPTRTGFKEGGYYNGYICELSECDEAARVKRCTTTILVSDDIVQEICERGKHYITNGITICTRPLVYVNYCGVYIYTYHATANVVSSLQEMKNILRLMRDLNHQYWMIMGDFNVSPDILTQRLIINESLRPGKANLVGIEFDRKIYYFYLLFSRRYTQGYFNGKRIRRLDYALVSCGMIDDKICNGYVRQYNRMNYSDHDEIGLAINTSIL